MTEKLHVLFTNQKSFISIFFCIFIFFHADVVFVEEFFISSYQIEKKVKTKISQRMRKTSGREKNVKLLEKSKKVLQHRVEVLHNFLIDDQTIFMLSKKEKKSNHLSPLLVMIQANTTFLSLVAICKFLLCSTNELFWHE